ncbi:ParB/RepB/Spo0J family partition protein [Eubacteriales bacterium OttesenSCG-928-N14]|nr:ParB/RepB/Spo0J family partition protein [Eubacteriales bacterium OttesenSCG-928-N14]
MSSNRLGKGLGALLGSDALEVTPVSAEHTDEAVVEIELHRIDPNPDQPRRTFEAEALEELADSIRTHGVLQPILLMQGVSGRYTIIAGERRWRAARQAGLNSIPAIVREYAEQQLREVALIENLQREDLNAMEEAGAIAQLIETYSLTQEEVASRIGKSRSAVTNSLRLLALPLSIQQMVRESKLSAGHARAILSVGGAIAQEQLAQQIVAGGLSVRQAERLAATTGSEAAKRTRRKKSDRDIHITQAEDRLRGVLGTKVSIVGDNDKGKITIEYFSADDLQRLFELLTNDDE